MTEKEFCRWLHGYFELGGEDATLTEEQVEVVKEHLKLIYKKVTPTELNVSVFDPKLDWKFETNAPFYPNLPGGNTKYCSASC